MTGAARHCVRSPRGHDSRRQRRQKGGIMGHFHCEIYNIRRTSGGNSAVKKAAYNSGDELHDNEQDKTFKFDKPEVLESKILLPPNAPARLRDRATLWNEAQGAEKDPKGIIAREFEICFPNELTEEQAKRLVNGYAKTLVRQGMCVDYSIHWKDGNHHAHVLATTRKIERGKFAKVKEKKVYARDKDGNKIPLLDENGKQKVRVREGHGVEKLWERVTERADPFRNKGTYAMWRKRWQNYTNAALKIAGSKDRVSCLSYKEQGIDKVPQIHEGRAAHEIEKRGGISERCQTNRNIRSLNEQSSALKEKKAALENELQLNKNYSEVTICAFSDLSLKEKKSVFKVSEGLIYNGTEHIKAGRGTVRKNAVESFVRNSVFAKNKKSNSFYLLPIKKETAIKEGLLQKDGKAKTLSAAECASFGKGGKNSGKSSAAEIFKAATGLVKDFVKNLSAENQPTKKEHFENAKKDIKDAIFKTPAEVVGDFLSNPLTGILKAPLRALQGIGRAASAGVNLAQAATKEENGGGNGGGGISKPQDEKDDDKGLESWQYLSKARKEDIKLREFYRHI